MATSREPLSQAGLLTRDRTRSALILALLFVSGYGAFMIIRPYLHSIIIAGLLVVIFTPVHKWLLRKTKNRSNLAAGLSCAVVALVVIIPLAGFTSTLVYRGINTFRSIQEWFVQFDAEAAFAVEVEEILDAEVAAPENGGANAEPLAAEAVENSPTVSEVDLAVQRWLRSPRLEKLRNSMIVQKLVSWRRSLFPGWTIDMEATRDWLIKRSDVLGEKVVSGVGNAFIVLLNFFLMLFVMFYFFRDGEHIMDYMVRLSPLSVEQEHMLIERVKEVTKSAVAGTLLTAVAQGVVGMIGLAVAGVPWLVWGVMMGFASLVPVIGTAIIWVPIVVYLFIVGHIWQAIFLLLWCTIVVGTIDNFLRPVLMQGKTGMSNLLLFFAILGGLQLFGIIGVIYGPLIFAMVAVMLYIFQLETEERSMRAAKAAAAVAQEEAVMPASASPREDDDGRP